VIPVLDSRSMRAADQAAIRGGIPSSLLMENAATALVEETVRLFPRWQKIVVVCGPGNNGGDGLAAARLLAWRGKNVAIFTLAEASAFQGDAAENAGRARKAGLTLSGLAGSSGLRGLRRALADSDGVVDALFGTGLSRGLGGRAAQTVAAINASGRPVVSADLPSGLSADSGRLIGPSVQADLTVAFAAPKFCHVLAPARARCGAVIVRDIGIPAEALRRRRVSLEITEGKDIAAVLPGRPRDSHKGDFGRLAIVAGARGKAGAAALAARGALRAGAGLVTVFCPASVEPIVVSALPEAMTRGLPDEGGALASDAAVALFRALADFDAVAVGPGLGASAETAAVMKEIFKTRLPIVCDADALNAFAGRPRAFSRRAPTVLTPHPGEAARLWGRSSREVQADRLACATALAKASRAVVVLKGAGSLIATPRGRVTANPTGTPLMSTAGAGDVLTGALGAFLAAGIPAEDAAIAAVFLHGAAGESLARKLGDAGLLASELADEIPKVRRRLCRPGFASGGVNRRPWKS
jgi:ADP-dependent NAD(P)H-hydrate dehydratase / NAD(P)H-hydrate epimerase